MIAVVDTGPLVAAVDRNEPAHAASVAALESPGLQLVVPAMVLAEATYLVGSRLGPSVEAGFLRGLSDFSIEPPTAEDLERMAELVETYSDFPLGGTDASVVALAERLRAATVVTLDHRHFRAIRPRHVPSLRLIP